MDNLNCFNIGFILPNPTSTIEYIPCMTTFSLYDANIDQLININPIQNRKYKGETGDTLSDEEYKELLTFMKPLELW